MFDYVKKVLVCLRFFGKMTSLLNKSLLSTILALTCKIARGEIKPICIVSTIVKNRRIAKYMTVNVFDVPVVGCW